MPNEDLIVIEIVKHLPGQHDQQRYGIKGAYDTAKDVLDKLENFGIEHSSEIGAALLALQLYLIGTTLYSTLDSDATMKKQMTRDGKIKLQDGDVTFHADNQKDIDKINDVLGSMSPIMRRFSTTSQRNIYLSSRPFSAILGFVPYKDPKNLESGGSETQLWLNTNPKKMLGIIGPKGINLFESQNRMMQSTMAHETAHNVWARAPQEKKLAFKSAVGFREKWPLLGYPGTNRPDTMANEIFGHMTGEATIYPNKIKKNYGPRVVRAWEDLTGLKIDDLVAEAQSIKKSVVNEEDAVLLVRIENKNGAFYLPSTAITDKVEI